MEIIWKKWQIDPRKNNKTVNQSWTCIYNLGILYANPLAKRTVNELSNVVISRHKKVSHQKMICEDFQRRFRLFLQFFGVIIFLVFRKNLVFFVPKLLEWPFRILKEETWCSNNFASPVFLKYFLPRCIRWNPYPLLVQWTTIFVCGCQHFETKMTIAFLNSLLLMYVVSKYSSCWFLLR